MSVFAHFLLTRFNVRQKPQDTRLVCDPKWLDTRFALFDRFCFPSVEGQTTGRFVWIVFFDADTPEPFRTRIREYTSFRPFQPEYVKEVSASVVRDTVNARTSNSTSHVITTRMDNDDAIRSDFVERVQSCFDHQSREVINFRYGYIWHRRRIYLHRDDSNAFASMIESATDLHTVWCRPHPRLVEVAPIRQITDTPAWLQVVHGLNVLNRPRGIRQKRDALGDSFTISAEAQPGRDGPFEFLVDRWVLSPSRNIREHLIRLGKSVRRRITKYT